MEIMKQRLITSVIALSLLTIAPAWGQTEVIKRPAIKKISQSSSPFNYKVFKCWVSSDGKAVAIEARKGVKITGNLVIPSTIRNNGEKYDVTEILYEAFDECTEMSSVSIPEGVIRIGGSAFNKCSNLTSVTLPSTLQIIESHAFLGCKKLPSLKIPDSVIEIGDDILRDNDELQTPVYNSKFFVRMPMKFQGAYNIPEGIEEICFGSCNGCKGLTSVVIPKSVTKVKGYSFIGCSSLSSVSISNAALDNIEYRSFSFCPKLEGLTVRYPDGSTQIVPLKDNWSY